MTLTFTTVAECQEAVAVLLREILKALDAGEGLQFTEWLVRHAGELAGFDAEGGAN